MYVLIFAGEDVCNTHSRQTISSSVAMHPRCWRYIVSKLVIYLETLEGTKF